MRDSRELRRCLSANASLRKRRGLERTQRAGPAGVTAYNRRGIPHGVSRAGCEWRGPNQRRVKAIPRPAAAGGMCVGPLPRGCVGPRAEMRTRACACVACGLLAPEERVRYAGAQVGPARWRPRPRRA